jgi:hypothetical protein
VTSFELGPGVVVDTDHSEIYLMSPEGGIVALDLGNGQAVWRSRDAAKPLAVSGDLLIGQAEPTGPDSELSIVALDTRQQGAPVRWSRVELPPGVQAAIHHGPNRSFTAHAEALGTEATVSWEYVERPLRGIAAGPLEVLPGEEAPPGSSVEETPATDEPGGQVVVARGAVRLGLADGTVTPIEPPPEESFAEPTPISPSAAAPDLSAEEQLPDLPGPQFLSADGSHVLISERIGDESVWEKWRWRIFERSDGRPVGEVRSHVRFAPFFVRASQILHLVEPHAHLVGDALVDEPVQVRAADLETGEPVWSQPVRDITDRDAPPP